MRVVHNKIFCIITKMNNLYKIENLQNYLFCDQYNKSDIEKNKIAKVIHQNYAKMTDEEMKNYMRSVEEF